MRRDGKEYEIAFRARQNGRKAAGGGHSDRTGTMVTFWPDPEIFKETTVVTITTRWRRVSVRWPF